MRPIVLVGGGRPTAGQRIIAAMADHPVRLVLDDDLRRSRLTVLLRLLLAIPHLIVLLLFTVAAFVVAVVGWFAALFKGRLPDDLHDFLSGYVRYATRVDAYLGLAANPWPPFFSGSREHRTYPVDVEIAPAERQRRWTIAFRLLLALPALLLSAALGSWSGTFTGGSRNRESGAGTGGLATLASVLGWFASLCLGRMPRGLRDLIAYSVGYGAQTWSYLLLLTQRYPDARPGTHVPPLPAEPHAVRLELGGDLRRSRLTVFFRLLLALPHLVWLQLWSVAVVVVALLAWLVTLVTGRNPALFARFLGAFVRYQAHVWAFVLLVGAPFPGFDGRAGVYPVDVTTEPAGRQHRLKTLSRLVLAVPALLLALGYGGVVFVAAVLGWFAALATGRMPAGLAELGAAAIRYWAQTSAYVLLVTDRYPFASPALAVEEPEPEPPPAFEPGLPAPAS
jgi:hypothetical protein